MASEVIKLNRVFKRYFEGQENELCALDDVSLTIEQGSFVAIVGASGSGKSTLMNIVGALDRPSEGEYLLDGVDIMAAADTELSGIRNKKIGFVFQNFNLIPRINAQRNVELPMLYGGLGSRARAKKSLELLETVGMADRRHHKPNELSGGQKQRIAIARAMANDPAILLADEPTGALDSKTGRLVMDIFHELHEKQGKTIILITHSPELAEETERIVTLVDGKIVGDRAGSLKTKAVVQ